jgi:hypothetical protein
MLQLLTYTDFFGEIQVFHQLRWIGVFGAKRAYQHLETPNLQKVIFQKLTQFSQGNNLLNAPASNTDGFLLRDTCVSSTYCIGLLKKKMTFLRLENSDLQEVFHSKTNSITQGNNVVNAVTSNIQVVFGELHVFLQLNWMGLFGTKWASSTLKTMNHRKYYFPKLTQYSQGNNVLDTAASNIDGFLEQCMCFFNSAE